LKEICVGFERKKHEDKESLRVKGTREIKWERKKYVVTDRDVRKRYEKKRSVYCDCWPDKHLNIFFKNVIYIVFYIDLFIVQIPSQYCWLPEDAFFIRCNILQENKHLNIYTVLVAVFCLFFYWISIRISRFLTSLLVSFQKKKNFIVFIICFVNKLFSS